MWGVRKDAVVLLREYIHKLIRRCVVYTLRELLECFQHARKTYKTSKLNNFEECLKCGLWRTNGLTMIHFRCTFSHHLNCDWNVMKPKRRRKDQCILQCVNRGCWLQRSVLNLVLFYTPGAVNVLWCDSFQNLAGGGGIPKQWPDLHSPYLNEKQPLTQQSFNVKCCVT